MQIENLAPDLIFSQDLMRSQGVTWEHSSKYSICFDEASTYSPSKENRESFPFIDVFGEFSESDEFFQTLAEKGLTLSHDHLMQGSPAHVARKKAQQLKKKTQVGLLGYGQGALSALYAYITFPQLYKVGVINLTNISAEELKRYRSLLHFHAFLQAPTPRKKSLLLIHETSMPKTLMNSLIKIGIDFDLLLVQKAKPSQFIEKTSEYFLNKFAI